MRDYIELSNLAKAFILGGVVTLMSVPRIVEGGLPVDRCIPVAFAGLVLTSAAATAWSRRGGMSGLFPDRGRLMAGVGIAALTAGLLLLVYAWLLDPVFRSVLVATGNERLLSFRYPQTVDGRVALILWAAGFETVFFQAGVMSYFSRLTGKMGIALAAAVGLRVLVTCHQLSDAGIHDATWLFVASTAVSNTIACLLFARAGLPAAMVFWAVLCLHVFIVRAG